MSEDRILGTDVAMHQSVVDWGALYEIGCRFVFIKATEGQGYVDPLWSQHLRGARDAGLLVGAYHVLWPNRGPETQADHFFNVACPEGLDLPPVLDFELRKGCAADATVHVAHRFITETERLWDKRAILYTYPSFFRELSPLKNRLVGVAATKMESLATRDLWIAHYGVRSPTVPAEFKNSWRFWQYDGDHGARLPVRKPDGSIVKDAGGDCDYNWFKGTEDDLLAYCGKSVERPLRTLEANVPIEVPVAADWVKGLSGG